MRGWVERQAFVGAGAAGASSHVVRLLCEGLPGSSVVHMQQEQGTVRWESGKMPGQVVECTASVKCMLDCRTVSVGPAVATVQGYVARRGTCATAGLRNEWVECILNAWGTLQVMTLPGFRSTHSTRPRGVCVRLIEGHLDGGLSLKGDVARAATNMVASGLSSAKILSGAKRAQQQLLNDRLLFNCQVSATAGPQTISFTSTGCCFRALLHPLRCAGWMVNLGPSFLDACELAQSCFQHVYRVCQQCTVCTVQSVLYNIRCSNYRLCRNRRMGGFE